METEDEDSSLIGVPGMNVHKIRLAGPWTVVDGAGNSRRTRLPVDRLPGQDTRLARRFGRPGRLDTDERVWLVIAGLNGATGILLNEAPLELMKSSDGFRVDVTDRLVSGNVLEFQWSGDEPGGVAGPVWLECVTG
ncbi:MAG TPA: hypothetical protein DCE43_25095 [Planctomycetaceae bacterium]|nr:hypothetical protein [Planctomycetaceae bacterium]HCK52911.1 hypothetical protein [Planctomycetaceae bacterium]|tara:strand:+ start:831 stop:1238 length:408 start_codon:yes stop_codon:yes gene_type:complete